LGTSSLSLICPCMLCLKRKICKEYKRKKNQTTFKYDYKRVFRRRGSYRIYLEGNSLHQTVMIVYECILFSHMSNRHNMRHLCTLARFSYTTHKFFATFDTCAVQCDLAIIKNTYINICSLMMQKINS